MQDKLTIKKDPAATSTGWKPVTVSVEAYQAIKAIADESKLSISKVACMLIEFAAERVVIED